MTPEDCKRAWLLVVESADGGVARADSRWLHSHLAECDACRRKKIRFERFDRRLTGLDEPIAVPRRKFPMRSLPAAAVLASAAMLLVLVRPAAPPERPFVEIPYVEPLSRFEAAAIVPMKIPVASLNAMGYRIAADPRVVLPTEVLVGEDGRPHAIRLPAGWSLAGKPEEP